MSIIKCKMCGGDINLSEGQSFGSCDSCGSTMTLPKVSDERKVNLFNRANHFRRLNNFDKALNAYENILNEDNTDAEAHWGVVLSRYGIEYVEDPISHNKVPTCHRMQMESILTDPDYLSALEYSADGYTRSLYKEEANKINAIQKGILSISQKEEPYDVFICYKETTDGGSRTKDSTLAQDIYYHLKQEGYKVFFSRITLEDKLGQEYEPYIFAGLNSSKVMVVVGTKQEHFNAVWVKNEWSRFLELIKKDRTKLLIPCYKDMDAYDLPEELSTLQSQDMAKIGFIQDLVRGIKKILDVNKEKHYPNSSETIVSGNTQNATIVAPGVISLLKRGNLFLEDSDFKSADEYFNRALDIDPENANGYIGKLMAELHIKYENEFASLLTPIENNGNYLKALRFADGSYKGNVEKMCLDVKDCIDNKNLGLYNQVQIMIKNKQYMQAGNLLNKLGNYKDCIQLLNDVKCKIANVGDVIIFGNYFQNDNKFKTPINWIVIEKTDDKLLILSKYNLDCYKFNDMSEMNLWEDCTLRKWLNTKFVETAFSKEEQKNIITANNYNTRNGVFGKKKGNMTNEKIFLFSIEEAYRYIRSDMKRQGINTAYAKKQGAAERANGVGWWWLRSPGYSNYYTAIVISSGGVNECGVNVNDDNIAVRPALYINLKS